MGNGIMEKNVLVIEFTFGQPEHVLDRPTWLFTNSLDIINVFVVDVKL